MNIAIYAFHNVSFPFLRNVQVGFKDGQIEIFINNSVQWSLTENFTEINVIFIIWCLSILIFTLHSLIVFEVWPLSSVRKKENFYHIKEDRRIFSWSLPIERFLTTIENDKCSFGEILEWDWLHLLKYTHRSLKNEQKCSLVEVKEFSI